MNYNFEWDPAKAKSNRTKHGVSFGQAATVFRDPDHLSVLDDDHSDQEVRWATIGIDNGGGNYLLWFTRFLTIWMKVSESGSSRHGKRRGKK